MTRMLARTIARTVDRVRARIALAPASATGRARLLGRPAIANEGALSFGAGVTLVSIPTAVQIAVAPGARVEIADLALIESGACLRAQSAITIGHGARIGANCVLDDAGGAPIAVGARAWLEDGVVLLAGAAVPAHARVTAGTIMSGTIVSGTSTPAPIARVDEPKIEGDASLERLRRALTPLLPAVAELPADGDVRTLPGWDSLMALRALSALEAEFQRMLPADLWTRNGTLGALASGLAESR